MDEYLREWWRSAWDSLVTNAHLRSQIFEIFWEQVLRKIGSGLFHATRRLNISERDFFLTIIWKIKLANWLPRFIQCALLNNVYWHIGPHEIKKTNDQRWLFIVAKASNTLDIKRLHSSWSLLVVINARFPGRSKLIVNALTVSVKPRVLNSIRIDYDE